MKPLGLDDDELVACVACGLCLPHCPTYRVTGLEIASPRGRIAAMRAVDQRGAAIDDTFLRAMDECVQCRGCEAACPSGVQFGHLMEDTRAALRTQRRSAHARSAPEWFAYTLLLPRHWLLLAATWLLVAAQKLHLVPRRFGLPRISSRSLRPLAVAVGGRPDAWLFTGCVMDAWMRDTHRSTARLMPRHGRPHRPSARRKDRVAARSTCTPAAPTRRGQLARRVIASMPGTAPIVVNSAGCGASMKEYGHLLGTPEAHAFAARVEDFSEWLVAAGVPPTRAQHRTVVVQDPCHLRHVQKAHTAVRTVLGAAYRRAGHRRRGPLLRRRRCVRGVQPELASQIRDRKVDALHASRRRRAGRDRRVGEPGLHDASPCGRHRRPPSRRSAGRGAR